MGGHVYSYSSVDDYSNRTRSMSKAKRFVQTEEGKVHTSMSSVGLTIRESRDSPENPITTPIIIALDVTGSMGYIPEQIVSKDLNKIVANLIKAGIPGPAICFIAIGDHIYDNAPLQVGQFESGDQQLIQWLTKTWLEGKGGGSMQESYHLAWLFASKYTVTDNWEKRGQKGFLITIGDEQIHNIIDVNSQIEILGPGQYSTLSREGLLKDAKEKWNVIHIHANDANYRIEQGSYGTGNIVREDWLSFMNNNDFIVVEDHTDMADTIKNIIVQRYDSKELAVIEDKKNDGKVTPML